MKKLSFILIVTLFSLCWTSAQMVPGPKQTIEYLAIGGVDSEIDYGNENNIQSFYIIIKDTLVETFYIRIFDPDIENDLNLKNSNGNAVVEYSVYGGNGVYWDGKIDNKVSPLNGKELNKITFDSSSNYNQQWVTMCKLSLHQGEYNEKLGGYIFKFNSKILSGKGLNYYKIFISNSDKENIDVKNTNIFSYELTFKLSKDTLVFNNVNHVYPYVDGQYQNIDLYTKGWNNQGFLRINSVARTGQLFRQIEAEDWGYSMVKVYKEELFHSMDLQVIYRGIKIKDNQLLTIKMLSDSTKYLPLYCDPIGGIPRYAYGLHMRAREKK